MTRTRVLQKLMEIPGLPQTTGRNIEISVYNHAISYANAHSIEAVWTNFIFKHFYVSKAQEILASLRDSPSLSTKWSARSCPPRSRRITKNGRKRTTHETPPSWVPTRFRRAYSSVASVGRVERPTIPYRFAVKTSLQPTSLHV